MQPTWNFGVVLGIYRTGSWGPTRLGWVLHLYGPAVSMCQTWKTDGLDRGPSNPSITAGHLPASSLINQHSTPSLRARFPARPTAVDIKPPLPVCLSVILPFVPTYLLLPAVCLAENRRLSPSPSTASERGHARTIITQPTGPYLELRPYCAIGCPVIFTTKHHNLDRARCTEELGCWHTASHDGRKQQRRCW